MSAGLSAEQLAEIRARVEAATPGPWGTYDDGTGRIDIAAGLEETGHGYTCRRSIAQTDDEPIDNDPAHVAWDSDADLDQIEADAAFIAHARTDVPALLAEVDRLTKRVAELETAPLAWTTQLDLKSLDNLLITLSQAADYEPMAGAIDQIHEVLRGFRAAAGAGESR